MDRNRWSRVKSVFLSASRMPPFLRRGWVWVACGRDGELRRVVLRLLDNAVLRDSFLELEPDTTGPRLPLSAPTTTALADLELQERIGQGGMGVVYKARQVSLDRIVAVKMLPDLLAVSESRRQAFENESRIVAGLKHPNIVPVFWSGRTESSAFYVMEYVEGKSLETLLTDSRDVLEPHAFLEPANVARFVARLANALTATHAHGVSHRDIKPGNVLVDRDGEPKLVDFGLARPLDRNSLTSRIVGTPHYMSPEQARLHDIRIDHRTDIYSLGVVMYEMLTLRRPFEGRTLAEVLIAIREREPARVRKVNPSIPRDLETICHKAMRKHPEQRYGSAAEFESDLLAFLDHRSPRAQPPTLIERAQAGLERHRTAAIVIALTALIVPVARYLVDRWFEQQRITTLSQQLPTAEAPAITAGDLDAARARLRTDRNTLADVETLRDVADALDDSQLERVDQAERIALSELARLHAALLDEIAANVRRGLADVAGTDLLLLAKQFTLLAEVLQAERFDRPDEQLAELLLPRITLSTQPPGATVMARRLDPSTGIVADASWRQLGTSDLRGLPIAPGYYRFVAVAPDGSYGELTQHIAGNGMTYVLPELVLRPTDEVARDMVRFEASTYATSLGERTNRDPTGAIVLREHEPLGAFLVDDREVTNAEYRAFCEATNRAPPFAPAQPDATWDLLPAAFLDVYSAEAYAAWAGKRLLTKAELRQALRGPADRRFPWGNEPADVAAILQRANVRDPSSYVGQLTQTSVIEPNRSWKEEDLAEYLRLVRPVGSYPDGRSAEGLFDLVGNVAEWTSSLLMSKAANDRWRPDPDTHLVLGLSYAETPEYIDDDRLVHSQATSFDIGFRCGRTAPEEVPRPH